MLLSAIKFALIAVLFLAETAFAFPAKYDQRQEGDLNVRTDVEDVVFVVVPPQDLVAAGMGLVAATAADLLRKNYGAVAPERWPTRTSSKLGFVPLEKSPYKIDLEKSQVHVKKIAQPGNPNPYNFHDSKIPIKGSHEIKSPSAVRNPANPSTPATTTSRTEGEISSSEMAPTTESKTVKKELKPEETKKIVKEQKTKETEATKKVEAGGSKFKVEIATKPGENLKVVGVETVAGFDPTSIQQYEGCGPEAFRDATGVCVYDKKKETRT